LKRSGRDDTPSRSWTVDELKFLDELKFPRVVVFLDRKARTKDRKAQEGQVAGGEDDELCAGEVVGAGVQADQADL